MGLFADIATAIKTDLVAVDDIGLVLDSALPPLLAEDWATFIDTFTVEIDGLRVVRAWTVGFLGTRPIKSLGYGNQKVLREVRYVIRGYLGRQHPDSEATFRDLIEQIVAELDADLGLGGTVTEHDPVEVDLPDNGDAVLFGDVVCHYAEIILAAKVEVTLPA